MLNDHTRNTVQVGKGRRMPLCRLVVTAWTCLLLVGCVFPVDPDSPGTADGPTVGVIEADLAPFVALMGSEKIDILQLAVGDQLILSVPESRVRAKVAGDGCACVWSVSPSSAGTFDDPNSCSTVLTIESMGSAELAVEQMCSDGTTRYAVSVQVTEDVPNEPPVADAGDDIQVNEGDFVELDGGDSFDSGDTPIGFSWVQTGGPAVELEGANSEVATFTAPSVNGTETLTFDLTVSDGQLSDTDIVRVEVSDVVTAAGLVFADAGADQEVSEGELVTLDGTGSSGSGLGALSHAWTQLAGVPVELTGASQATASFVAPDVDVPFSTLTFQLTASENGEASSATVDVVVVDEDPPAADEDNEGSGGGGGGGVPGGSPGGNPGGGGDPGNNDPPDENDPPLFSPDGPFMRFAYGGAGTVIMLPEGGPVDQLLEDGIEHFGIKLNTLIAPVGQADTNRLRSWSQKLNPHGAKVWAFFNWFSAPEENWLLPLEEPYVSSDGVEHADVPCPQSQHFWDTAITSRLVALTNLTDPDHEAYEPDVAEALMGVVVDPELYQQDDHVYRDACFCESCFAGFFAMHGINDPVPAPQDRLDYLQNIPGMDGVVEYDNYEIMVVEQIATQCRLAVRAVNPDMEIGGFAMVKTGDAPFYIGVSRGWGTADRPMFDFQQRTFYPGFNASWTGFVNSVNNHDIHAILIPGLFIEKIPPEAFADHFYTLSLEAGGAYVYHTGYYADEEDELCFPLSEYRQHITEANFHLDQREADPSYVAPYTGAPFVPACIPTDPFVEEDELIPLEEGPADPEGLIFRRETGYYFHADAGESIAIDVSLREFGSSDNGAGWWMLLSPNGDVLDQSPLTEAQSPSLLRVDAVETGVHVLIVNTSFVHGFYLDNASHPGSYRMEEEDDRLNIFKPHEHPSEPQLVMYVPPGETTVQMEFSSTPSEGSQVLIYDERDLVNPLFDQVITSTFQVDIDLPLGNDPAGDGVVLELVFRNQPQGGSEDMSFRVVSGAMPYFSQTRSGLFREP